jgi:hypothetical protein
VLHVVLEEANSKPNASQRREQAMNRQVFAAGPLCVESGGSRPCRKRHFLHKNKYGTSLALGVARMIFLDGSTMLGLAAMLSALSALVWSFRRKP